MIHLNNKSLALVLFFVTLLTGCGSAPADKSHYYLLNAAPAVLTKNIKSTTIPAVLLEPVLLAEYLTQPSLLVKLDDHQLHFSRYHLWAENLQASISKVLLNEINTLQTDWRLSTSPTDKIQKKMTIQIDHFYANQQAKVILAGQYWLTEVATTPQKIQNFYFELPLLQDGYPHSVAQMRQLLTLLAQRLVIDMNEPMVVANQSPNG